MQERDLAPQKRRGQPPNETVTQCIGADCRCEFEILVNRNWHHTPYPVENSFAVVETPFVSSRTERQRAFDHPFTCFPGDYESSTTKWLRDVDGQDELSSRRKLYQALTAYLAWRIAAIETQEHDFGAKEVDSHRVGQAL